MFWLLLIVVGLLVLAHHGPGAWRVVLKRTIYAALIVLGSALAFYVGVVALVQHP